MLAAERGILSLKSLCESFFAGFSSSKRRVRFGLGTVTFLDPLDDVFDFVSVSFTSFARKRFDPALVGIDGVWFDVEEDDGRDVDARSTCFRTKRRLNSISSSESFSNRVSEECSGGVVICCLRSAKKGGIGLDSRFL